MFCVYRVVIEIWGLDVILHLTMWVIRPHVIVQRYVVDGQDVVSISSRVYESLGISVIVWKKQFRRGPCDAGFTSLLCISIASSDILDIVVSLPENLYHE